MRSFIQIHQRQNASGPPTGRTGPPARKADPPTRGAKNPFACWRKEKPGRWKKTAASLSKLTLFVLLISIITGRTIPKNSLAENIRSDNYQIDMGHTNMGAGLPSSANYTLDVTTGQTAPGEYTSTGYIVKAGFQYIHSIIPFSFSISDISVDFGTLTPQTPSTSQSTLTVSAGGAGGYQVTALESDTLKNTAGTSIPDTTCDGGANTCTETSAKPWTLTTAYGFGYNMTGDDIPSDFTDSTYYRPFPSEAASENPAVVMSSSSVGKSRQSTITYKVNISSTQAAGTYQNIITFVATPTY